MLFYLILVCFLPYTLKVIYKSKEFYMACMLNLHTMDWIPPFNHS